MPRLSVNLNKIALLRNSRRTGVPDVLHFGRIAHDAGADGLTAHPRPDERHIRRADALGLAELMRPWRPGFELNIEGYPDRRLLDLVAEVVPEQCTLVPDAADVLTSEEGWKLSADDRRLLDPAIPALKAMGCRVILFVDPDPAVVERVRDTGADGIEIYTGSYSAAFRAGNPEPLLQACAATAARAAELGLVVNIGHDLNLDNLPPLTAALPGFAEASIGHELTADALVMGFAEAVRAYKAALIGAAVPMSYVTQVLQPGETVLYETKLHWWIYLPAIWPLILSAALGLGSLFVTPELGIALIIGAGICLLLAIPTFLRAFLARATTELAVTSKRVIHKTGLFRRHTFEMNVSQVESVGVEQSILGRIFGFGELAIYGAGGNPQRIPTIRDPLSFRSYVTAR